MTDLELRLLLKTLIEHKVQRYQSGDVHLEFATDAFESKDVSDPTAPIKLKVPDTGFPSDDELLFASTPYPEANASDAKEDS